MGSNSTYRMKTLVIVYWALVYALTGLVEAAVIIKLLKAGSEEGR